MNAPAKFIWDISYACPLRCIHCYSESGRRAARTLDLAGAMRVVDVLLAAKPDRISLGGGEPLLVPWCIEAARRLSASGILVSLFTSGWVLTREIAEELASAVGSVAISIDGGNERIQDTVRGRRGAFTKGLAALETSLGVKQARQRAQQPCFTLGIDYTVTRLGSNITELEDFVDEMTSRLPGLDFIRFGAVIPGGLASEESFESELLTLEESTALVDAEARLAARAHNGTCVTVTDVRLFLSPDVRSVDVAQIEPDGGVRAFPTYEAKVGNLLEEPIEVLWSRALAWRADPFVAEQLASIRTMADWAHVTRTLDRRFGSLDDRERFARRAPRRVTST
jgi:MoaA/NifB/PqqE/SkfB family radical SAM enzyme